MSSVFARVRQIPALGVRLLLAVLLLVLAAAVPGLRAEPAYADTAPPEATTPATVASDALPTAQMDGVAWTQLVVGDTVFVGGSFANARPANAAPGVSTVARTNLMAYTLSTGELTSFAPTLDAQVRSLAVSADGKTLYVGGQFTKVNGVTRNRIAAFTISTGALTSFNPNSNSTVYGLTVSGTTLFAAGNFTSVSGVARLNGAGINLTTGALTGFNPVPAGGTIQRLAASPDGSKVVVGGNFTAMGGSSTPGYGLALLNAATGANLPMPVNNLIRNGGTQAAITSLVAAPDGSGFYGSGYSFQKTTGNLEGAFRADWNGNLVWVEDCHGDTYSVFPSGGALYVAGHPHYCGNLGGFPQTPTTPWPTYRALAFGDAVSGVLEKDQYGYFNYEGQPKPTLLNWFPDMNAGTVSGQAQGPWSVAGNADYVVYAGEFTTVNFKAQQGLVRFARTGLSTNTDGPRLQNADFVPTATSYAHGVRVSWPANHDRDNESLTYSLIKNGNTANPVYTTTSRSTFWQRPQLSYFDRAVTPGKAVTYRLRVTDPKGNMRQGDPITVTPNSGRALNASEKAVLADSPQYFWPLNESAGSATATDLATAENGTIGAQVTAGVPGAVPGETGTAFRYSGTNNTSTVSTQTSRVGMNTFSVEAWFRSTSTTGGKIIGWGAKSSGSSGNSDRLVYLGKSGKVYFGVYPAAYKTVGSTTAYNNGQWHHVAASLGPDGMKLYVDGTLVGSQAGITQPQINSGYWRVGGDYMSGWPDNPSLSSFYAGDIDNAAVYNYVLSPAQVAAHRAVPTNVAPSASFTASVTDSTASVNAAASTDSDGVVASYAWDFGDNSTGTGATASHAYAGPGTYTVKLTVTDENGSTHGTTRSVTVSGTNAAPTADFRSSGDGLDIDFDGSTSTDPDGTVADYSWNFGDGKSGTGATVDHTYATGGTYSVTLTVTDDRGGKDTETKNVVATAPTNHPFASDAFSRTSSSGLGTADVGGVWNSTAASGFAVGSGVGVWKLGSAGASRTAYLGSTLRDSTDLTMDAIPSAVANGGGVYLTVLGRRISSTLDYRTNVKLTSAGKVQVSLGALKDSATAVSLSTTVTLPGTFAAGDVIHVRMQTYGSGSTTVQTKVWLGSASEPSAWTVSATDSYAALQSPGSVGLTAYVSGTTTNFPADINVPQLVARPVL